MTVSRQAVRPPAVAALRRPRPAARPWRRRRAPTAGGRARDRLSGEGPTPRPPRRRLLPTAVEANLATRMSQGDGCRGHRDQRPGCLTVIATNGHARTAAARRATGTVAARRPITLNLGATKVSFQTQADAPSCADCGSIMVRNGSCYKCLNCGSTSGCS